MENEIWLPVKGYEGLYEVSHYGIVKSLHSYAGLKERIIKLSEGRGRLILSLHKDGKRKSRFIHTLVLEAFNCHKPDGLNCCHNDGDYRNNYIGNLRWDTSSSNMQDAIKHGKRQFNRGEKSGLAKLKTADVFNIRKLLSEGKTKRFIAKEYNVARSSIINISQRKTWAHV